jgi:hypothetical protein
MSAAASLHVEGHSAAAPSVSGGGGEDSWTSSPWALALWSNLRSGTFPSEGARRGLGVVGGAGGACPFGFPLLTGHPTRATDCTATPLAVRRILAAWDCFDRVGARSSPMARARDTHPCAHAPCAGTVPAPTSPPAVEFVKPPCFAPHPTPTR